MASVGPLGAPPAAPVANPVMWAAELPANRHQADTSSSAGAYTATEHGGVLVAAGVVFTPVDIEERAAEAHDMTFHTTSEASGARLDPHDPRAPFGATAKDVEGQPLTELTGPQDDPYGIASGPAGGRSSGSGTDTSDVVGDGSMAEAVLEAIRHGDGAHDAL